MTIRTAISSALVLALAAAGCSRTDVFAGQSSGNTALVVTPSSVTVEVGRSQVFVATVTRTGVAPVVAEVDWTVEPAGSGQVDAAGLFTAPTSIPAEAGGALKVLVRATLRTSPDVTETARITVIPQASGPATALKRVSGDNQTVGAGVAPTTPLRIQVVDAKGAGVPGIPVRFASPAAEADAVTVTSDAGGFAEASPVAASTIGDQSVAITSPDLNTLIYSYTVKAGPLASLKATHPTLRGATGTLLADPAELTFTDRFENPIQGAGFTWEAPQPDGEATPLDPVSDSAGKARVRLKLASATGTQQFKFKSDTIEATLTIEAAGGPAATLEIVKGDGQTGVVGQPLTQRLVVKLLDAQGNPAGAGTVSWSAPDGAEITDATTIPDADGFASAQISLGRKAGLDRIVAESTGVSGSPATFALRAVAGGAVRLQLVSGEGQATTAGGAFGGAFSVRATDAYSNAVEGVQVSFAAVRGGGSVGAALVTTGQDGLAQTSLTAGTAGAQSYRASAPGLFGSPIDITLNALAPIVDTLEIISGTPQTGTVGVDLPQPFTVRLMRGGRPVAGRTVTFGIALGDGFVRPSTAITAGDGTALATGRLGSLSGAYRFSASVAGATNSPVFFEATATGRAVALLRLVSGGGQSAAPGAVLPQPFVVEALGADGQPVTGVTISVSTSTGATVDQASATTDASGRISVRGTLQAADGNADFTFTAGAASLLARATATTAPEARRIRIVSGNNQTAEAGLALPLPLEVKVTTVAGAPVVGVVVQFRGEADLSRVSTGAVTTDDQGVARTTATLGNTVGTQRFFAEVDATQGSPLAFTATATQPPAERLIVASGDGQSALAGQALPSVLVARAVTRVGTPVPGVSITFAASSGGGSVTPATAQTSDTNGEVRVTARLGSTVGAQTFSATAAGLAPAVFTATGTVAVQSVSVSPAGRVVEPGAAIKYVATAIYTDSTSATVTDLATWVSTQPTVATVSDAAGSKGVVNAVAAGGSSIRATYAGFSGEASISVNLASLRSITILPADPTVVRGSTRLFRALGTFSNNVVSEITESATWTSNKPAIATVSDAAGTKALVKGIAQGVATITATFSGITATRDVTISQAPLIQLEATPLNVVQPAGTTAQFQATATYEDGTTENVTAVATWGSSDTTKMTLQNAPAQPGRATFLAAGTPSVTVTYGGRTATVPVTITQATVTALSIFPDQVDLHLRDFMQLNLIATYSDGSVSDAAQLALWTSSVPASVDVSNANGQKGFITALAVSGATITARIGNLTATTVVNVSNANVARLQIQGRQNRCPAGGLLSYRAIVSYTDRDQGDLTDQASWISSDPTIAVTGQGAQGGYVQCLKEGNVTITATWGGQSGTQSVTVTAAQLSSIEIAPASATLARGDTRQFFATGRYTDGSQREISYLVTWSSSNASVLTVSNAPDARGRATALTAGQTNVVALLDGVTAQVPVTVTTATITALIISPANQVVPQRQRGTQFNATALYDDNSTQDVTEYAAWSSSNPNVAIVSNDANFIGGAFFNGTGTTTISATYAGKRGQTTLTVR